MKKFVKRHHVAIIFILLLIIVAGYLPSIFKLNALKTFGWKRFTSKRVPLSFSYPPELPLTQCEAMISEAPASLMYDEFIYFSTDCSKESKLGYIEVNHDLTEEETRFITGGPFGYNPQLSEKTTVGGHVAYKIDHATYFIYTDKYRYKIVKTKNAGQIMLNKMDAFLESFEF